MRRCLVKREYPKANDTGNYGIRETNTSQSWAFTCKLWHFASGQRKPRVRDVVRKVYTVCWETNSEKVYISIHPLRSCRRKIRSTITKWTFRATCCLFLNVAFAINTQDRHGETLRVSQFNYSLIILHDLHLHGERSCYTLLGRYVSTIRSDVIVRFPARLWLVPTIRKERASWNSLETIPLTNERTRYLRTIRCAAITHVDISDLTNSKLFQRTTRARESEWEKRETRDTTGGSLLKIPARQ